MPNSWDWCRFSTATINRDGERIPLSQKTRENLEKKYDYYGASGVIDKVDKYLFNERLLLIGEDGANLITRSKPIAFIANGLYWVNNHAHVLQAPTAVLLDYLCFFINAIPLDKYVTGSAQPKMTQDKMNTILIPLPPLAEQQRIVEQIETLLGYVDIIDTDVETLEKSVTLAKQKILDLAIRGKLVPQDPSDEPASELLKKIKAEKDALIKAGKIKRDKYESFIFKGDDNCYYEQFGNEQRIIDNIPFKIPDNWVWGRLEDIALLIMGQSPAGNSVSEEECGIEFHQGKIYFSEKILLQSPQKTTEPTRIAPENSVLICVRAPVGTVNINPRKICIGRGLASATPLAEISTDFLFHLLNARKTALAEQATGSTFISVTGEQIKELLIPLPPLQEQKKIVSCITQYETILKSLQE